MGFLHDFLQIGQDFRILRGQIPGFAGIIIKVVEFVVGVISAHGKVNQFPGSFAHGLAAAQFLEFKVQIIVFFLPLQVAFQKGEEAHSVEALHASFSS